MPPAHPTETLRSWTQAAGRAGAAPGAPAHGRHGDAHSPPQPSAWVGGLEETFYSWGSSLSQNDSQHWTGRQTPPNTALSGDTVQNGKLCFFNIYFYLLIFYLAAPVSVATRRIFSFGMWDPAP